MAGEGRGRNLLASVRVRATVGASLVVAIALVLAAVALVILQRSSLEQGAEDIASARADQVAAQVMGSGPPERLAGEEPDEPEEREESEDVDSEPDSVVVQVQRAGGVVVSSQRGIQLPEREGPTDLAGADEQFVLATADASWQGEEYVVVAAVSLDNAEESTSTLIPLLLVGIPALLVIMAGVLWMVVGRALRPVEAMRREVATVSEDRLEHRVPVPASRDEVHRLGVTMNEMLQRLQDARDRQRRFVSDASHELRSPIATLRQTGEVSAAHPGAVPPEELTEVMMGESVRMQHLVDQLLTLTRTDERGVRARQDVDLDDLLLSEAARARSVRADLKVDSSGVGPARVHGDPGALGQLVRNLVDNAIRHARSEIRLSTTVERGMVRCVVADDGAGVPPGERERIFERFVRLDEARTRDDGGSGLGLAIVAGAAAAHGGRVVVTDAPGGGASFEVELPAAPDAS